LRSNGNSSADETTTAPGPRPSTPERVDPGHLQHLVGIIATGGLDEHLATVSTAIHERHRQVLRAQSHQAAARIDIGDRVQLNHTI
jgi:hypothetical protein